jgi:hypothetical protein
MVCVLLHNATLGPEYWSFALLHAVHLKNQMPLTAIKQVPYTAYTGRHFSAKHLRIFGCPLIILNPAQCCAKLDLNTTTGIFLGYTATDKNVNYQDSITKHFKTTTHCVFDEAWWYLLLLLLPVKLLFRSWATINCMLMLIIK